MSQPSPEIQTGVWPAGIRLARALAIGYLAVPTTGAALTGVKANEAFAAGQMGQGLLYTALSVAEVIGGALGLANLGTIHQEVTGRS